MCEPMLSRMTITSEITPIHRAPTLLALREWHEEIRAGYGGARVAVRTLDGVSISVHAGELVILRGGVAGGAEALLSALSGTRAAIPAAHLAGERLAAPGVQIRKAAISINAFRALHAVWTAPGQPVVHSSRVIYCFRVRPERERPEDDEPWRIWARTLRAAGGSIVAQLSRDDHTSYPRNAASRTASVFENAVDAVSPERATIGPGRVHDLTLAGGRIVRTSRGARGALRIDPLHSSRRRTQDRSDRDARDSHY